MRKLVDPYGYGLTGKGESNPADLFPNLRHSFLLHASARNPLQFFVNLSYQWGGVELVASCHFDTLLIH